MQRFGVTLAVVVGALLAALALPALSAAAPSVSIKAKIVPIKGFPHTGNFLGAGAAVEANVTISGNEYGGFPAPLIGVNVYLPKGTVLHPSGFPTCPLGMLEPTGRGPKFCPKGSAAGPVGKVTGDVAFGTEVVPETATVQSFYAPGGGLTFFTFGHSPVLLEIISSGKYVGASGLYSKELKTVVPLVETVPGAQDASVKQISIVVGSAIKKQGKTIYYGRVPSHCKGSLPAKTELTFAGLGGLTQTTVTKTIKLPCPRK